MRRAILASAFIAFGGIAASASAEVLVSMTYDDLSGSYDFGTGIFNAGAVDNASLRSSGDASRLVPGSGNASFSAGFVSAATLSDFQLTCTVVPGPPNTATGTGNFTATDINGDTITGTISGNWGRPAPGFIFFNGTLTNVQLNRNANGFFEGDNGGSWDMVLPAAAPYEGAIVQLVFGGTTFFTSNFANRAVGVTAQIIPAPGALALVGLGALAAVRRRTR